MYLSKPKIALTTLFVFLLFQGAFQAQAGSLPDFTELVKKSGPSVVNISTKQKRSMRRRSPHLNIPDLPEGSPFGELFRHFFGEGENIPDENLQAQSLGSGFFISEDGYVLTNHHVVSGADEIIVRTSDRREFVAEVVGSDKRSDVALLKIDAKDLPVAKIAKNGDLQVGEWVLAIGTPFGFDHSVTAGIVSAMGRNLPSENYVPFIQTDVAINPGNSGGPLFNLDGEVVGVNSQIYSRTGGFMGLSFAIPISVAMNVVEQLRTKGHVTRGWLGVLIQDVTRELAESFGMSHPQGALIAQVLPDSPAEKAGLEVGDIILTYNGRKLPNSAALPPMVGATRVDREAKLEVLRSGRKRAIGVVIGELPEEDEIALVRSGDKPKKAESNRLGVSVVDLTEKQRKQLGIEGKTGVLVESVDEGPARAADIREGDVILMLNQQPVESADQFRGQIEGLPAGKSVAVLVHRGSGRVFLALKLPK